jgi:hypothetical protein
VEAADGSDCRIEGHAMITRRARMVLFLVLATALPASANNPPQPDGLFAMLLVFPVALLAGRLALVATKPKKPLVRIIGAIATGIVVLAVLATGTGLGAAGALCVVGYAFFRATDIMSHGASPKRRWLGLAVMTFSLFAFMDYVASIVTNYSPIAASEAFAAGSVRSLATAESDFVGRENRAGSLEELQRAGLIDDSFAGGRLRRGYRYGQIIAPDQKQYLFFATPDEEMRRQGGSDVNFIPGSSLVRSILGVKFHGAGARSFAVDQTNEIRFTIRKQTGPVTREEVLQWQPLG